MLPEFKGSLQHLLADKERGYGVAMFGWASVTLFACLTAFASWQFAPSHSAPRDVRVREPDPRDVTGTVRQIASRPSAPHPTTAPVPGDSAVAPDEIDAMRQELKDLRRVVGRLDASTDVLARRIANLEDSFAANPARPKPNAGMLPPIDAPTPPGPRASEAVPEPGRPLPAALHKPGPGPGATTLPLTNPTAAVVPPTVEPPPVATPVAVPPAGLPASSPATPVTSLPAAPPASSTAMQSVTGVTMVTPVRTQPAPRPLPTPAPGTTERQPVDRATLERMLLERAPAIDGEDRPMIPAQPATLIAPPKLPPAAPVGPPIQATAPSPAKPVTTTAVPSTTIEARQRDAATPPAQTAVPQAATDTKVGDPAATGSLPVPPDALPRATEPKPPESVRIIPMRASKPEGAEQTAALVAPKADIPAATRFGIDLGSYSSVAQVRKAWTDLGTKAGRVTRGLSPLAQLGESADGLAIRLTAGPFPTQEDAQKACHQLKWTNLPCAPGPYSGSPLGEPKEPPKPKRTIIAKPVPPKLDLVKPATP